MPFASEGGKELPLTFNESENTRITPNSLVRWAEFNRMKRRCELELQRQCERVRRANGTDLFLILSGPRLVGGLPRSPHLRTVRRPAPGRPRLELREAYRRADNLL